jgi:hypothetical protein
MVNMKSISWFDSFSVIRAVNNGMTGKTSGGSVIVGGTKEAWYGQLHEFGLGKFPPRPYMVPALNKSKQKFPACFEGLLHTQIPALVKCALIVESEAKQLLNTGGNGIPSNSGNPPNLQSGVLRASITHEVI